jgi:hypothetical protein
MSGGSSVTKLEFLVRTGPEVSSGFEAVPPGGRSHVAGV